MKPGTIVVYVLTASLLLSGCGPGQVPEPTIVPTSTDTPLPPTPTPRPPTPTPAPSSTSTILPASPIAAAAVPKVGHWEGTGKDLTFDFRVTSDGHIHDLMITYVLVNCTATIADITIGADGRFASAEHRTSSGKELEVNRTTGTFLSVSTMSGETGGSAVFCEASQMPFFFKDPQSVVSISAAWKTP